MTHRFRVCAIAALALAASACNPAASTQPEPPLAGASIGGPFRLVDKSGKSVRWDDFAGKYRIVYFGYAFCPDACPMDVGVMIRGFNKFAETNAALAAKVQPIFISIDPARDTPQVVGQFTAAFSPRLIGLTGSADQVAQAAKAFAVYYLKGEQSAGGYLMDHSRIAYLMGPDGAPIAMLPVDKGPDAVTAELAQWIR